MNQTAFFERLTVAQQKNNTFLVVGLDPIQEKIPRVVKLAEDPIFSFNKAIVDATLDLVCAYKPNIAFYEAAGLRGLAALKRTIDYIPKEIPVILDAKRGDVAHSSKAYAEAIFEHFGADATTVNPYLGIDSIEPFLNYTDRGTYLLCLTSNPGYETIQSANANGFTVFQLVAKMADSLSEQYPNIGLVVGATHPQEGIAVRKEAPDLPFLIPGIGAQQGFLEKAVRLGTMGNGTPPAIVSARAILYASSDEDFKEKARAAAIKTKKRLNTARQDDTE